MPESAWLDHMRHFAGTAHLNSSCLCHTRFTGIIENIFMFGAPGKCITSLLSVHEWKFKLLVQDSLQWNSSKHLLVQCSHRMHYINFESSSRHYCIYGCELHIYANSSEGQGGIMVSAAGFMSYHFLGGPTTMLIPTWHLT